MIRLERGPFHTTYAAEMTENRSGDITIPRCADLFRLEFLGGADTWRGRVIRAFMWLMDYWPIGGA